MAKKESENVGENQDDGVVVPMGSPVWFYPSAGDAARVGGSGKRLVALVAWVNENGSVNLCVFDRGGGTHAVSNVQFVMNDEDVPEDESFVREFSREYLPGPTPPAEDAEGASS